MKVLKHQRNQLVRRVKNKSFQGCTNYVETKITAARWIQLAPCLTSLRDKLLFTAARQKTRNRYAFNDYVFTVKLAFSLKQTKFQSLYKPVFTQFIIHKLVSLTMFAGKGLQSVERLFYAIKSVYSLLWTTRDETKTLLFKGYSFYKEFLFNFKVDKKLNNISYILQWVLQWMQPMFSIDCAVVPKKYRKRLKKKYMYKIKYLTSSQRQVKALRWIVNHTGTLQNYELQSRLLVTLLDLLFNYKNSYVYLKKVLVYKKVLGA